MGEEALRETEEKDDVWSRNNSTSTQLRSGKKEEGEKTDPSCTEKKKKKKKETGEKELLQVAAEDINLDAAEVAVLFFFKKRRNKTKHSMLWQELRQTLRHMAVSTDRALTCG